MTTATDEKPATETSAPVDTAITSVFYGTPEPSKSADPPAPASEKGPEATPSTASATAPETGKSEPSKGEKAEPEKPDAKGHEAAARRLGNEVKALKSEMEQLIEQNKVLQAKVDGTYREPEKPTQQAIEELAEFKGREAARRSMAFEKYGEDVVRERVYAKGSEYEQLVKVKPWVQMRVLRSPHPAMAAMHALELEAFESQYGADPSQWVAKLTEHLRPTIKAELEAALKVVPTGKDVPSVTDARSTTEPAEKERSITDIFFGAPRK